MTKSIWIVAVCLTVACQGKENGSPKAARNSGADANTTAQSSGSSTAEDASANDRSTAKPADATGTPDATAATVASSPSPAPPTSCANVTCSGHGRCVEQVKVLSCECGSGYFAKGTECLPHPHGDPNADAREGCKNQINRYRATLGLTALVRGTPEDEACADQEGKQDSISKIMHGAFGRCNGSGNYWQNMCLLWSGGMSPVNPGPAWTGDPLIDTTDCLGALWGEGPGGPHYEEMIKPDIKKVDCGVYIDGNKLATPIQNFR
ncbi:MAG: hypothetical protein NTZ90_01490 [Proteobacteria bacterium]|nr:hypothetical protein [Pseudomonadota bacterium]